MGKDNVLSRYLAKLGSAGGKKSAAALSKAQRVARAKKAGLAAAKARATKAKKGGRNAANG